MIQVGDVFRKAIQDMNEVVKENVESSFSRQNFAGAIDCLKLMRSTALGYEEVETYNKWVTRKCGEKRAEGVIAALILLSKLLRLEVSSILISGTVSHA